MSDGGDDRGSPWLRDDWTAPPAAPFPDVPSVVEPNGDGHSGITGWRAMSLAGRVGAAAGAAVVVLVLGAVVFARGDDGAAPADAPDRAATEIGTGPENSAAVGSISTDTTVGQSVVDPPTGASDPTAQPNEVATPGGPIAPFVVGEIPAWVESTIEVPSPLADMAVPTELVVKADNGVIHRIDLPSGRVRSLDASELGIDLQVVVGPDAIALHNANNVVLLRDDVPVTRTSVPDGVSILAARPGRDDFILVPHGGADDQLEPQMVLGVDGRLTDPPPVLADRPFWESVFLPSGDLVVNRPGGVYAIGDDGTAERIHEGALVATGSHHYAVERCSATLVCEVAVIETATGATVIVDDAIARAITSHIGTQLSPDGASALYISYGTAVPERRVADMATATSTAVGGVDQLVWGDAWAVDSSGVFTESGGVLRFIARETGAVTEFVGPGGSIDPGLGTINSVITRPPPAAER